MLTKKEVKLLTEVLNLEGVKVAAKHQHEGIGIILRIESIEKGRRAELGDSIVKTQKILREVL